VAAICVLAVPTYAPCNIDKPYTALLACRTTCHPTFYLSHIATIRRPPTQDSLTPTNMSTRRLRSRKDLTASSALPPSNATTRPRRNTTIRSSGTTIERSSPEQGRDSIRLTVKAPPSKLAEATSGLKGRAGNVKVNSRDTFEGGEIVSGPRSGRKKAIVEESSEEEDEPDPEADYEDEDDGEQDDIEEEEDEEEDEEEEEEDVDMDEDAEGEDVDMDDAPPPPPPKQKSLPALPKVTVSKASQSKSTLRGAVEEKEMVMDDDDEELSELTEEDDELAGEEDAEGEEVVEDDEEGDEDEDEEDEDSEMTPATSRGMTPDLSKLTRRQRAAYEEYDGGLMALSNEAQKKKHLTAEEYAARRAEMTRRRKNLSEKRNEEEKMDTINRLLKKQAPKRRRRVEASEALAGEAQGEDEEREVEKPPTIFARYVGSIHGPRVAVPEGWLDNHPLGRVFENAVKVTRKGKKSWSGRMVEEVA